MSYHHQCECGERINKFENNALPFYFITDGDYLECPKCKAKYKSKFKMRFFNISLEMYLIIIYFIIGNLVLFSNHLTFFYTIMPLVAAYRLIVIYFLPLVKIDETKENMEKYNFPRFWDKKKTK